MSRIRVERLAGALAGPAALRIATSIRAAVRARGRCTIALAGGSTPRGVYEVLASLPDIPWEAVVLAFGDERCVPPDDPRSNFRMVRESLLQPLGSRAPHVLRMEGEDPSPAAAARRYDAELRRQLAGTPPDRDLAVLDLAVLGLGTDGHTASLFPGDPFVDEPISADARLVAPVTARPDGLAAITLTRAALAAARERLFLVAGAGKAEIVARVSTPGCSLPAARVGAALILFADGGS